MPFGNSNAAKSRCNTRRCPGTRDGAEAWSRRGRIGNAPSTPTAQTCSRLWSRLARMSTSGMRSPQCELGTTRNAPFPPRSRRGKSRTETMCSRTSAGDCTWRTSAFIDHGPNPSASRAAVPR